MKAPLLSLLIVSSCLSLAACGGSSGSSSNSTTPSQQPTPDSNNNDSNNNDGDNNTPTSYTLNGTLSGLASGTTVTITDGITPQTLNTNGNFSFFFAPNAAYSLSVTNVTAPAGYEQTCTVSNGSGTANSENATLPAATISCSTAVTEYSLKVTVTGLATGTEITLTNLEDNDSYNTLSTNGTSLLSTLKPNDQYDLSVSVTQPDWAALNKDAIAGSSVWMHSCAFAGESAEGQAVGTEASIALTLNCGSYLYFATDGGNGKGNELWRTDGSESGTSMVADINPGIGAADPSYLTVMNGKLYFAANDGTNGTELWVTDGTANGTNMVADINATGDASPAHLIVMNDKLYFAADDGDKGSELWVSDGTAEGTNMLKDIRTDGKNSSNPQAFVLANNTLYFAAGEFNQPARLWKTDGTKEGTQRITAVSPINIANLTLLGDKLYFSGTTTANGAEPWVYNITTNSGAMIIDANTNGQASNSSSPSAFFSFNDQTYFIANQMGFVNTIRLYRTDGTAANTQTVAYVHKAAPVAFNNELLFLKCSDSNCIGADDWAVNLTRWDGTGTSWDFPTETFTDFQVKADSPRVVIGDTLYFQCRLTNDTDDDGNLCVLTSTHGPEKYSDSSFETYQLLGGSNGNAWVIDNTTILWSSSFYGYEEVVNLSTLN